MRCDWKAGTNASSKYRCRVARLWPRGWQRRSAHHCRDCPVSCRTALGLPHVGSWLRPGRALDGRCNWPNKRCPVGYVRTRRLDEPPLEELLLQVLAKQSGGVFAEPYLARVIVAQGSIRAS